MSIKNRERDVENYLVEKLRRYGLVCLKFQPEHRTGMPDRLVLLPDQRCLWVELKTKGGHLETIQELRHKELQASGQRVAVVWSREDVDNLINNIVDMEMNNPPDRQ